MRRKGLREFSLGLTQEECASTLGVHRATLARAVRYLKEEGVIGKFTRASVTILDSKKLLALAGL